MNTQTRRGQAGFSFVELLVTIIIAGIAFAALVPLFVAAQQKGSGDTARNVALSLARDKMEKIRSLDYDEITEANLQSATFKGGQFGTSIPVSGGGGTKNYTVAYTVTFAGGSSDGQHVANASSGNKSERYKQVTVDAYWTGNPKPVKHAVLETSIYKQYMGSRINKLVVSTEEVRQDANNEMRLVVADTPVKFTAFVNDADESRTSKVTFVLYNYNGQVIATLVRLTSERGAAEVEAGSYEVTYAVPTTGAQDGTYTVQATATNIRGYSANTEEKSFTLETDPPPTPVVTTVAYDHTIDLTWPNTSAGDVVRYEIFRSADNTGTTYPLTPTATVPFSKGVTPSFHDTGLTNDPVYPYDHMDHAVYYRITAVDDFGNVSLETTVYDIPHVPMDDVAPRWGADADHETAASLTGSVTTSPLPPLWVQLTWGQAFDPVNPFPKPTSGMSKYWVYRSADNGATWQVIDKVTHVDGQLSYTWTDQSAKPVTTYQYYVRAVDGDGNQSTATPTLTFTTPNYLYNHATVRNDDSSSGYNVNITNLDGSALSAWPIPPGPPWTVNTTLPFAPALSKASGSWKDTRSVYLAVGFTYKILYQSTKNGIHPWESKNVSVSSASPSQLIIIP